eukprot:TRINITY_DN82295_c0_g1_i1.p1 TRINITY_DN82295_c0_g1~~TRINITY_DN82295_c0_g1_i1.p1  ORF type:complete len:229 (-),score=48.38 TRINITY_DN82295_c0_g1_i1:204-890(-)
MRIRNLKMCLKVHISDQDEELIILFQCVSFFHYFIIFFLSFFLRGKMGCGCSATKKVMEVEAEEERHHRLYQLPQYQHRRCVQQYQHHGMCMCVHVLVRTRAPDMDSPNAHSKLEDVPEGAYFGLWKRASLIDHGSTMKVRAKQRSRSCCLESSMIKLKYIHTPCTAGKENVVQRRMQRVDEENTQDGGVSRVGAVIFSPQIETNYSDRGNLVVPSRRSRFVSARRAR